MNENVFAVFDSGCNAECVILSPTETNTKQYRILACSNFYALRPPRTHETVFNTRNGESQFAFSLEQPPRDGSVFAGFFRMLCIV